MTRHYRTELLRRMSSPKQRGCPSPEAPDNLYPLTSFQTDIWLACAFRDDEPSYHIPIGLRIDGHIDTQLLRAALDAVVERNSILRATFRLESFRPVQSILPAQRVAWETVDLRGARSAEDDLYEWIRRFIERPFQLADQLPLRAALIAVAPELHVAVIVVNHLVFDAWSTGLLLQELLTTYDRLTDGRTAYAEAAPGQYVHYAMKQLSGRQVVPGTLASERSAEYARTLQHADVQLPTDFARPESVEYPCATVPVMLSRDLVRPLHQANRLHRTTSFMLLLAMFNLVLYSRCERNGLRIASPVSCRQRPEHLTTIGCFVNTLLFVLPVHETESVKDYLQRCRAIALNGLSMRDQPFNALFRQLRRGVAPDRQAPYGIMFSYQDFIQASPFVTGAQIRPFVLHNASTKCDLTLLLAASRTEICGTLEYRTDLYRHETAAELARDFIHLVSRAVMQPDCTVAALLRGMRRHRAQANIVAEPALLHARISTMAEQVADRIAIQESAAAISYRTLDRLANRLARVLLRRGVTIEDRVGVLFGAPVEIETVICALAVLKVGAAYVPFSDETPRRRATAQINDSALKLLLCSSRCDPTVASDVEVWRYDSDELLQESAEPFAVHLHPENLAYVIYTSGLRARRRVSWLPTKA